MQNRYTVPSADAVPTRYMFVPGLSCGSHKPLNPVSIKCHKPIEFLGGESTRILQAVAGHPQAIDMIEVVFISRGRRIGAELASVVPLGMP